jgi:murein L,D-transpeptidase YafK
MRRSVRRFAIVGLLLAAAEFAWIWQLDHEVLGIPSRIDVVRARITPHLQDELRVMGFALGDPVFIRIFKESRELELWMKPKGKAKFELWMRWPIAGLSGQLGPKLAEGDHQVPEGFYEVGANALNPVSNCHLSFNTGFPNAFDQALGRTGSWIMVHGGRGSVGCFAITDPVIEEVYVIVEAALKNGQQTFAVHSFPFRMTDERMTEAKAENNEWLPFWENLREGYDRFERTHVPPQAMASDGRYVFDDSHRLTARP